jgi:exonuclease SbcD
VLGRVARPDEGGVLEHTTVAGEPARFALLPFCSQRYAVRAAELMAHDVHENVGRYADQVRQILGALTSGFGTDAVNVVVAHCMVRGGKVGGGEREAQTAFEDYWVDASAFPASAGYVALGHLHLAQKLPGGPPLWYCGAPIQVDFGEAGAAKHVLLVDAAPGKPAQVQQLALRAGTELRTITGTLADVRAAAERGDLDDAWLRVRITEPGRAGLADEVRALLGERVVDVRVERSADAPAPTAARAGRSPEELFRAFLAEQEIDDDRLVALFARLHDEEVSP